MGKVQTYQRERVPWGSCAFATQLAGASMRFTACGSHMWQDAANPDPSRWRTVFNGVELERYPFVASIPGDAPLVFLGRLDRIKGAHHAIAVARRCGRRLVLAGPRATTGADADYFDVRSRRTWATVPSPGSVRWTTHRRRRCWAGPRRC